MVNHRDSGGNTPLHLAAEKVLIGPALLLLKDPRVDTSVVNGDGETVFAISCRKEVLEMSADEIKIWKKLKKHESNRCKQQRVLKTWKPGRRRPPYVEGRREIYILVATLIAMATFTATFTMPGRYSRQSGFAVAGHRQPLKIFVACNTISMCSSTAVILLMIAPWWDPPKNS
ncbi:hypothetical protein E2562_035206 [Oryza meyeriana var. granulata]|uniref:PGG domain-containing protein n=1 Tax=Oryza meyeriana var. granulata TaxID=110450 RepID=A0A6G1DRY8_9ORYZ|nr:hypothetical protein E2562_035206 [Oryza meyeriana var. granulata]